MDRTLRATLIRALKGELPGTEAQYEMAPGGRRERVLESDPSGARESAVLILIYPHNNSLYLPLMKRPDYGGVHSGQVSFPGGKAEEHDLDLLETALRETHEETGVPTGEVEVLGTLTELYIPPSNFLVTPFLGIIGSKPFFKPDPKEVELLIQTDIREFMKEHARQHRVVGGSEGQRWEVPSFIIQDYVIWGATAMIMSELLRIIDQYNILDHLEGGEH